MKKVINIRIKGILIFLSALTLMSASVLLYREIVIPHFNGEKVPVFKYTSKSEVQYSASLKPNILYEGQNIGEDIVYIASFVDIIKPIFNYTFVGEASSAIKGDYEVSAVAEGYVSDDKTYKTIWKKGFIIVPKTPFSTFEKEFSVSKVVDLKYDEFNGYAVKLIEDSKVDIPVKLTVSMNVNLNAKTGQGEITETAAPSIVIPLNVTYFDITKGQVGDNNKAIEKVMNKQIPPSRMRIIIYGTCGGLALAMLLGILLFTKGMVVDKREKNITKILKVHNSRLVAVKEEIAISSEASRNVRSFEDLVRMADELGKPIMYRYDPDIKMIRQFYVHDNQAVYIFKIEEDHISAGKGEKQNWRSRSRINHMKANEEIMTGRNAGPERASIGDDRG